MPETMYVNEIERRAVFALFSLTMKVRGSENDTVIVILPQIPVNSKINKGKWNVAKNLSLVSE